MISRCLGLAATIVMIVVAMVMIIGSFWVGNDVWLLFSMWYFLTSFVLFVVAYWRWLAAIEAKNNAKSEQKGIDKLE